MDGLRVPLIVYNPKEPFHYDQDETISLSGLLLFLFNQNRTNSDLKRLVSSRFLYKS